jgi:iron complex outermembrane recepter protein
MDYKDQLVLTGALNDVGGNIRTNVADSYRTGIELALSYAISDNFTWSGNVTFSQNKINEYEENLNDYLEGGYVTNVYDNTDIAYSPNLIGTSNFTYTPAQGLDIMLFSKYVSSQYLDNTQNDSRKLDPYFVNDIIINYSFSTKFIKEIGLNLLVNNVFNAMYESNGYAFGYLYGEEYREAYYYPQAGTNFLAGVSLRF